MDDLTIYTLFLLPVGLGLLGFIEPCTVGGHLIFIGTQERRSGITRSKALATFVLARTMVLGGVGALIAEVGRTMIDAQTTLWLAFGLLYVCFGLTFLFQKGGILKIAVNLAPAAWRNATNPLALGLAFGLNIPACAAPILFGLLAMAATTGTAVTGFMMMAVFGLALSFPLVFFVYVPRLTTWLEAAALFLRQRGWILGAVFIVLGAWSIWFGLNVDPADWSGQ